MSVLSDELVNDPLTRGYAGMTDAEILASLHAVDRPGKVPPSEILSYVQENTHSDGRPLHGKIMSLADGRDVPTPDAPITAAMCRDAALIAIKRMETEINTPVDMSKVSAMLDLLIVGGAIESADKTAILALADNRQSRAVELGIPKTNLGDVIAAGA